MTTTIVPATMQALVLADFGVMTLTERPTPRVGEGEALVRVHATGICGSDLHGYTGENGRRVPGQVMGHETVGSVAALGPGTAGTLAEGDVVVLNPTLSCGRCERCAAGMSHICANRRVMGVDPTISSAFAEYFAVPEANLVPFRGEPAHGALVEPLAVGYHAAVRGGVGPGMDVVVIGGGPIGQAAALAARRLGAARVSVSEPSTDRRALLERLGVEVLDPAAGDVAAQVLTRTGGAGAAVVIDAVGASATLATALDATVPGGACVLVGMAAPRVELAAFAVSTFERSLIGTFCYPADEFAETAAWAEANPDLLDILVSAAVPAAEGPATFAAMAAGDNPAGKVLVTFGPGALADTPGRAGD